MRSPLSATSLSRSRQTRIKKLVDVRALVISGGSAHGAFAVGAADVLINEKKLDFDRIFPKQALESIKHPFGRVERLNRFFVIRPSREQNTLLEGGGLDFEPGIMARNLERGQTQARKVGI
jgi:hypothetical protein